MRLVRAFHKTPLLPRLREKIASKNAPGANAIADYSRCGGRRQHINDFMRLCAHSALRWSRRAVAGGATFVRLAIKQAIGRIRSYGAPLAVDKRCMNRQPSGAAFLRQCLTPRDFANISMGVKSVYSHLWIRLCIAKTGRPQKLSARVCAPLRAHMFLFSLVGCRLASDG